MPGVDMLNGSTGPRCRSAHYPSGMRSSGRCIPSSVSPTLVFSVWRTANMLLVSLPDCGCLPVPLTLRYLQTTQLATTIVAGFISRSDNTIFWVQTQYVPSHLTSDWDTSHICAQYLVTLSASTRYTRQPGTAFLEETQSPVQPRPIVYLHAP